MKWARLKGQILELQNMLERNPIQDACITLIFQVLIALLDDKIKETEDEEEWIKWVKEKHE